MQRRKFSREFKIEAVRLILERGVSVAQASRDIDVHDNVLRKWAKELGPIPNTPSPIMANRIPSYLKSTGSAAR